MNTYSKHYKTILIFNIFNYLLNYKTMPLTTNELRNTIKNNPTSQNFIKNFSLNNSNNVMRMLSYTNVLLPLISKLLETNKTILFQSFIVSRYIKNLATHQVVKRKSNYIQLNTKNSKKSLNKLQKTTCSL